MIRQLAFFYLLCLAACTRPGASGITVIVGARLDPGGNQPPIEHSVVVIADGHIQAAGPQATTPVPKGAEVIRGTGKLVMPISPSASIQPGAPADLVMSDIGKGVAEKIMQDGKWL